MVKHYEKLLIYDINKENYKRKGNNMSQDKTDITVETYDNIVEEYISYFKTKNLNGKDSFKEK